MKAVKLKQNRTIIIFTALGLILVMGGFLIYLQVKPDKNGCGVDAVSSEVKATNDFDTPCEIIITVNNSNDISLADVRRIAQPINGTVESNDLSDSGIYYINVPAGTEEKSIQYLKSQPLVDSATRNHCCVVAN